MDVRRNDHWIANSSIVVPSNPRVDVTDPTTNEVVASVARGSAAEVDLAVDAARAALSDWAGAGARERGRLLLDISRAMLDQREEFERIECQETGKLAAEGRSSLEVAAEYFEYYGGTVRAFFGETMDFGDGQLAYTQREPYGVIGLITPWNGPISQLARSAAVALAAGNTIVCKPAEFTSTTSLMFARLAAEIGLPAGVFNIVTGRGTEVGSSIIEHPDVRMVSFTGSVATGKAVAAMAAKRLIPVHLELGGKSPNIVFDDADLARAAEHAATFCTSAGQQCSALSRLLVQRSVYDKFVEMVTDIVRKRIPGPSLGPLTTPDQYETVLSYFEAAKVDGARLVHGGHAVAELAPGRYVEPTVYADVTPDMRIYQEEIFGPVLVVTPFDDIEQAIELANDSEFGLAASIWTSDVTRAFRVASKLQSGQVAINGGALNVDTPFGGYKASGIGREKGFEAFHGYTQVKAVSARF